MDTAQHPKEEDLVALAAGRLSGEAAHVIREHSSHCSTCSAKLARPAAEERTRTVAGPPSVTLPSEPTEATELLPGARIGRFEVVGTLGKGGMGVVYAGRDPELEREVALKLLQSNPHDAGMDTHGRARLVREAQAMARPSHPNVVTVHEVGTYDSQVFVAMERVDGTTLKKWLREKPRTWREVLAVFLQAGSGLAAAHAAGFIHRDFKPDNVLVRPDGRAQVTDFGLARVVGASEIRENTNNSASTDALSSSLTLDGTVVGTLAYMAPEQLSNGKLDERTDEFNFGIALFEALYGQRPYERIEYELQPRAMPKGRKVPGWLRRVVLKSIALEPNQRYPSMDALLKALEADPTARRKRIAAIVGVLAVGMGSALTANHFLRTATPCDAPERQLDGFWDDHIKEQLQAAFLASGAVDASERWKYAEAAFSRAAARWLAAEQEVCTPKNAQTQAQSALQLRLECLSRLRDGFHEVAGLLSSPSVAVVEAAVPAIQSMKNPVECADARVLPVIERLPPAQEKRSHELRARLIRADAMQAMGQDPKALDDYNGLLSDAATLGNRPLEAEVRYGLAHALSREGKHKEAIELVDRVLREAEVEHMDLLAADAAALAATETSLSGAPPSELDTRLDSMRRAVERAGNSARARARMESVLGAVLALRGNNTEALLHKEQGIKLTKEVRGPDDLGLVLQLNNLAASYDALGRYDECRATLQEAITLSDGIVGPDGANLHIVWTNLAWVLHGLGRLTEAQEATLHTFRDPEDAYAALAHAISADAYDDAGDHDNAIAQAARGLNSVDTLSPTKGAARLEILRRAAKIFLHAGQSDRANQLANDALALGRSQLTPDAPDWTPLLGVAGEVALVRNDPEQARPLLERALRLATGHPFYPGVLAEIRFHLAEALVLTKGDHAQILELVNQAGPELAALPAHAQSSAELVAWRSKTLGLR